MRTEASPHHHRLTRILPHVVDTAFLASGIALALVSRLDLSASPWLWAKLAGLVAYIVLGSLAIKRAPGLRAKTLCFLSALSVFGWMVSVAVLKSPLGFLASLFS